MPWTKAVSEISYALGVKPGEWLRVLDAPVIFWLGADQKKKRIGGISNPLD